jgi:dihydrofolate reductase
MNLTRLHDFMQVLHIKTSYSTKDDYFPAHIQFTAIYLLQKQKLKHNNYSE